jgi:hypothetical protein
VTATSHRYQQGHESLFSEGVRTDRGPAAYTDSEYETIDRRASPVWDNVRATLDEWFRRLPASAQRQIRQPFSSRDRGDHLGAFWEMYLHEALTCIGFDVQVDIGNDATGARLPDLFVSRGDVSFYVEATAAIGHDVWTPQQTALANQLYDAINHADVPNFLVDVTVEEIGKSTPERRDVAAPLEAWLNCLDANAVLAAEQAGGDAPSRELLFDGWRVEVTAYAVQPPRRDAHDHRLLGSQSGSFGAIEDTGPLRRKLKKKAKHYGVLEHPYVIAVLSAGTFVDDEDISHALYGSRRYFRDPSRAEWLPERQRDGLWMQPAGPVNTRVSAIITATALSPFAIGTVMPRWWTNRWAKYPLSVDLPWGRGEATTTGAVTRYDSSESPKDLLGLSEAWPHAE